jgi:two-component system, NtrC family, sensor histidine kinase KinB
MRTMRSQLLFSHLLLVLLMLVVMIGAVINFALLGGSIRKILKDNYASVRAAQVMKETLERQDSGAAFLLGGEGQLGKIQFETNARLFEEAYQAEAHNITEPGEQQMVNEIGDRYRAYHIAVSQFLSANPPPGKQQAHDYYFGTLKPSFKWLKNRAQDVLDLNQQAILRASHRAEQQAARAAVTAVAVAAISVVMAMFFSLRMIRLTLAPLGSLARQAEEIGAGRWNQRIELNRADEMGVLADAFNSMAARISESFREEEQRLHRAERMSDAALENLYDPVIVTDAAGCVVHLNQAAAHLFGPQVAMVGLPAADSIKDRRIVQAIGRAIHQERVSAAEDEAGFVTIASADRERTYRLRVTPMRDSSTLLGAVAVLEDITHLRELDRLKTEFIGVASHELRTPVTSLLLSVQLLQEGAAGELTPAQTEIISAQREDLERLQRMMQDLLELTRLEAGITALRRQPAQPADMVKSAATAVQNQANQKGVRLITEAEASLPQVSVDAGQIVRVLINLANNAIRHTEAGGEVCLGARQQNGKLLLTVRDTGCGIPAEYSKRIFERFVQVPGATRGGAGLGLSIARSIAEAHGGTLSVESTPGKGSLFTVQLEL